MNVHKENSLTRRVWEAVANGQTHDVRDLRRILRCTDAALAMAVHRLRLQGATIVRHKIQKGIFTYQLVASTRQVVATIMDRLLDILSDHQPHSKESLMLELGCKRGTLITYCMMLRQRGHDISRNNQASYQLFKAPPIKVARELLLDGRAYTEADLCARFEMDPKVLGAMMRSIPNMHRRFGDQGVSYQIGIGDANMRHLAVLAVALNTTVEALTAAGQASDRLRAQRREAVIDHGVRAA